MHSCTNKMMGMKPKSLQMSPKKQVSESGSEKVDWELRPCGMLVQKRNPDSDRDSAPSPTIRVRVKHASSYHEIYINSRATFGELKKMLAAPTGLHPQDQKLLFKNKERDSKAYLDVVGVKERSKIVLVEDPLSQERRYVEMRKTAKIEKASKSISEISLEVDKLATRVSTVESLISKGGKVAEIEVLTLIELLMNQLIKLDGIIVVDGDMKLQRKMQVQRVQKYVETLDMLKIKNATTLRSNGVQEAPKQNGRHLVEQNQIPMQQPQRPHSVRQRQSAASGVVVTTKWETFDPSPPSVAHSSTSSTPSSTSTATPTPNPTSTPNDKLIWELFE